MPNNPKILPTVDGNEKVYVVRDNVNYVMNYWELQIGDCYEYQGRKFRVTHIGGMADGGAEVESVLVQHMETV